MTATTPNRGYPYPEGTDLLGDTHTAIQALADAVDADLDASTLEAITLTSGWTSYGAGFVAPGARKCAGLVVVEGLVNGDSSTSGSIGQLPTGYRPASDLIFVQFTSGGPARVDVLDDGSIKLNAWGAPLNYVSLAGIVFVAGA